MFLYVLYYIYILYYLYITLYNIGSHIVDSRMERSHSNLWWWSYVMALVALCAVDGLRVTESVLGSFRVSARWWHAPFVNDHIWAASAGAVVFHTIFGCFVLFSVTVAWARFCGGRTDHLIIIISPVLWCLAWENVPVSGVPEHITLWL